MTAAIRPNMRAAARPRRLSPSLRKLVLTLHIGTSVAWLGVEACMLALGLTALGTGDSTTMRACYIVMGIFGNLLLIPLAVAALVTGLVLSLGTVWGVFAHWWVVAKLAMNVALVLGTTFAVNPMFQEAAGKAADGTIATPSDLAGLQFQVVGPVVVGIVLLTVATVLSTYKPFGRIRPAQRKARP
jgi:hypothetical protein